MSRSHTSPLPLPTASEVQEVRAARQQGEHGRKLILWGWTAAMLGVAGYCRGLFSLEGDPDFLEAVTRTGALGWLSSALILGGIGLWLRGNLLYLREAMSASQEDPDRP